MNAAKCDGCGRFIPARDMGENGPARFYHEPLSDRGPEVNEWTCGACVAKERRAA